MFGYFVKNMKKFLNHQILPEKKDILEDTSGFLVNPKDGVCLMSHNPTKVIKVCYFSLSTRLTNTIHNYSATTQLKQLSYARFLLSKKTYTNTIDNYNVTSICKDALEHNKQPDIWDG